MLVVDTGNNLCIDLNQHVNNTCQLATVAGLGVGTSGPVPTCNFCFFILGLPVAGLGVGTSGPVPTRNFCVFILHNCVFVGAHVRKNPGPATGSKSSSELLILPS